jgi:anti-sigma regulatory factor (Ser/Thr protein kinase)/CheY-like chemotaxis protein
MSCQGGYLVTLSYAASATLALAPVPRKTALIAESDPATHAMLSRVLAEDGWVIERAVDNKSLLSLARAKSFDIVITGQHTPGAEDVKLLREIRLVRPHVRMIILVDQWTPGDILDAMRAGAFSYFCAPFDSSALRDMLRSAMEQPAWDDGIEVLSATLEWTRLLARCDRLTADRLVQFMRAAGEPILPENEKDDVITAFHEILLNAMEHGANFDPSQYVELAFVRSRRAVTCRVKDPGQGFSLAELRHAATSLSPPNLFDHMAIREAKGLRAGGFGIMLAKKLVDELIYNEQGNDVLLVKYIDAAPAQRSAGSA